MKNLNQDRRYFDRVFSRLLSEYKSELFPEEKIETERKEVFRKMCHVQMDFVSKVLGIIPVCIFKECRNICPGRSKQ
jgi:hypothetical protein